MNSLRQRITGGRVWSILARPAATAVLVVAAVILMAPVLSFVEVRALDELLLRMPPQPIDPRIEVIDIGEDSTAYEYLRAPQDTGDGRLEIPRLAYAKAARLLSRWGAKVIVFDLMFKRRSPHEDAEVAEAFREAGNVVVAAATKTKPGAVGFEPPVKPLDEAVWAAGSPAAHQPNETVRSIPLVVRDRDSGQEYLALSLLAFQCFMGAKPSDMQLSEGRWLLTAERKVPLLSGERIYLLPSGEGSGGRKRQGSAIAGVEIVRGSNVEEVPGLKTWNTLLINWAGRRGMIEPHLLSEVLAISDDAQGRELFGGKAVIIGRMDWDTHWTAVGAMPGPQVQANALYTLISGKFIRPMAPWSYLALLAAFAVATAVGVHRFRGWRSIGVALVLTVVAVVLARQLLVQRGTWMYLMYCELGVLVSWGVTTASESDKVTALLARFVPSFLGAPQAPRLGEVRTMDASILFSDIRGYTSTAEQLSAHDTLTMLNIYHSAVEDIITNHGGTIVKTPGDAILAVFWQERRGVNHATCALEAGRGILADLSTSAQAWEAAGVGLDIGVGINAGSVAIGLVGKTHLEPTVIGDPVNVAQRLEELTKTLGYPLIFSESVRVHLPEEVEVVDLDEVTLRGRKTPIKIYGVAGPEGFSQLSEQGVDHADRERTNES